MNTHTENTQEEDLLKWESLNDGRLRVCLTADHLYIIRQTEIEYIWAAKIVKVTPYENEDESQWVRGSLVDALDYVKESRGFWGCPCCGLLRNGDA